MTYLYRLYDKTGTLLYVGISRDLKQRRQSHVASKLWWHEVVRWHLTGPFMSREAAAGAERDAISTEHPLYNVQHAQPYAAQQASRRAGSGRYMEAMTVHDVAARLAVRPCDVKRLIAEGAIPAQRDGRGFRVNSDDVDAFIVRCTIPANSQLPIELRHASYLTGVHPRTIQQAIDRGELGGLSRYHLTAWLDSLPSQATA